MAEEQRSKSNSSAAETSSVPRLSNHQVNPHRREYYKALPMRLPSPTVFSVCHPRNSAANIRILAPTNRCAIVPTPYKSPILAAPRRHRHSLSTSSFTFSSSLQNTHKPSFPHHQFATMASATNFFDFKVPNSKLFSYVLPLASCILHHP